jgi:hypothetical protein
VSFNDPVHPPEDPDTDRQTEGRQEQNPTVRYRTPLFHARTGRSPSGPVLRGGDGIDIAQPTLRRLS